MARRKRYTAILLILLAAIGVLVASLVLYARYRELTDFSDRLSKLVTEKTKGHYRLHIDKEEKDFFNLRVTFHNILLEATSQKPAGSSIESVSIPRIAVNIGSLRSWLLDKQIDVQTFVVDEPIVKVRTNGKRNHNVNITRSLLDIYPAVEEVLNNFVIHSFTIQRGNLRVNNAEKEVVNLGLIDFLVQEWNMRELDATSQLALHIGRQDLPIEKSTLSFSAIEFKYPQHYLLFKDLSFTSRDTLSNSQINVKGANILIEGLDYDELYQNERYRLKKIEVQHPSISGVLRLAHNRKGRSKDLLANILRQTFGEATLDSAILKKANIDITFANGADSINTQLPEVDISIVHFAIPKENDELQIGGLHINLNETALRLNDDVVLQCDGLGFERNQHLDIENARLTRAAGGKPFIECKRIHLKSFQLIDFIFDKQLHADSVVLEDANVALSRTDLALFPHTSPDSARTRQKVAINLGVLALKNVNFHYHDSAQSITAKGIQARFHGIHEPTLQAISKQLARAEAKSLLFENRSREIKANASQVIYAARNITVGQLSVNTNSISVRARSVKAKPTFITPSRIDAAHWHEIAAVQLSVYGTLPEPATSKNIQQENFQIDALNIANLTADLRTKETTITCTGKAFLLKNFSTHKKMPADFSGKVYNLNVVTNQTHIQADSLALNLNGRSRGHQLRIEHNNIRLLLPYAAIGRITHNEQATRIDYVSAHRFTAQKQDRVVASADSVALRTIRLPENGTPRLDEIIAYGLLIPEGEPEKKRQPLEWPEGVGKITVYKGKVMLPSQKTFRFNHAELEHDDGLKLDSGWYNGTNTAVCLGEVNMSTDELSIGLLQAQPTREYIQSIQTETDILEGTLRNVQFTDFSPRKFLNGGHLVADDMTVGHLRLTVQRDKRLPDPPPTEKPFFLHELLPAHLRVNNITVADGTITYSETSEKTGKTGEIAIQSLRATIDGINGRKISDGIVLKAQASLYGQAPFTLDYRMLNANQFQFKLNVEPCDLTALNRIMVPLQSIEIRSGRLLSYTAEVTAGRDVATGFATMSYRDLHLEIQKTGDPAKRNVGKNISNTLLTFVADGLILRNNKTRAKANIRQNRIAEKSAFNYWIKITTRGALSVIRHGKQDKQDLLESETGK